MISLELLAACAVLWTSLALTSSSAVLPAMESFQEKQAETKSKWTRDIVTVLPDPCTTNSGTAGICYKQRDCDDLKGTGDGDCALGVGVCCTFTYQGCYQNAENGAAVFQNPSYPASEPGVYSSCPLNVKPANKNVCQIRLDFGAFTLAGPDNEGVCTQDSFTVTGASSTIPTICGENSGQHLYLDVTPGFVNVLLDVKTSTPNTRWQISVTQIDCTSSSSIQAPSGCLQYYTGSTGTIKSFNYVTPTAKPT
ncbi:uncharacterized protein LOC108679948, partial [Hyalella azteca]|uniref:Uncharacterized protein LOC108679948 n=1 Tax=Hyalella azteca TaxID=294128 RepID=A0A8B7PDU9_HYAAZ